MDDRPCEVNYTINLSTPTFSSPVRGSILASCPPEGPEVPLSAISTCSVLYNAIAISSQEATCQEKSSLRGVGLLVEDSNFS